jgi:hypothetical protein
VADLPVDELRDYRPDVAEPVDRLTLHRLDVGAAG